MKFRRDVQGRGIAWPTQKNFDPEKWAKRAEQLVDDEADKTLAQAGLWVAETLAPIRDALTALPFWGLGQAEFARYAIGLCNRAFAIILDKRPVDDKGQYINLFVDEQILDLFDQHFYGSGKASDLVESSVDGVDRLLGSVMKSALPGSRRKPQLADLIRGLNAGISYQMAEDIFHQALWLDWRIQEDKDAWLVYPEDAEMEKLWEASWRRFAELRSQEQIVALNLWNTNRMMRTPWYKRSGGAQIFELEDCEGLLDVQYVGRVMPESPPTTWLHEKAALQAYYRSLIEEPLPSLNNCDVLDILTTLSALGDIAELVMKRFAVQEPIETLDHMADFSPLILHRSLVAALAEAYGYKKEIAKALLNEFTWRQGRSLWFHPLVNVPTRKGPAYLFTMLPLVAPNIYRVVDYWLAALKLPIARRGELFEDQIATESLSAAHEGKVDEHFVVVNSTLLRSDDGSSEEEIDALFLLHDLVVVAEAKCQILPTTPTDRHNYMATLMKATQQAKRKAAWVQANRGVAAQALGINADLLSGQVQPIVITNHSIGAGLVLHGVPVLDLLLLKEYLSRPYLAEARFSARGLTVQVKGERFYNTPREMADRFQEYAVRPPFIEVFLNAMKPSWQHLPLRADKPVLRLQYLIQSEKADTIEQEAGGNGAGL